MPDDPNHPHLSPEQERTLACVLDEIIPASKDGKLPGAGALGLAAVIGQVPELMPVVVAGLSTLDNLARRTGSQSFRALAAPQKRELLDTLATEQPAFLPGLIYQTYVAYYQEGRVVKALGLEHRPPHPLGYAMEPSDLSLLDAVRQRRKMYRKC